MRPTGAQLVVRALEAEGVPFTFGIPGTHNTELYDALNLSEKVQPILVSDERGAAFIADGVSRTSAHVGVLNLVPGAGLTHAMSGIAEALMDSAPLVAIVCGVRTDTGMAFQLHDVDQVAAARPLTKAAWRVETQAEVAPAIRRAFEIARAGEPGPVVVEIPVNVLLFQGPPGAGAVARQESLPEPDSVPEPDEGRIREAVDLIAKSAAPALYVGNGAAGAAAEVRTLAEALSAPVSTTIQGIGVMPFDHPLHLWAGFGEAAPRFVRRAMADCDCLIAVGCKFGEVATGSYGMRIPPALVHVDVNGKVLGANYRPAVAIRGDARAVLAGILGERARIRKSERTGLAEAISRGKRAFLEARVAKGRPGRVSPARFFRVLRALSPRDAVVSCDSGNHTFLAVELMPFYEPRTFVAPVDFSCMGYGVPAAIGAKMASPARRVVAVVGDGGFLMTGMEMTTAATYGVGVVVCVFRDEELGLIAQFQQTPLAVKTCTRLGHLDLEAIARGLGVGFLRMGSDADIERVLIEAFRRADRREPVLVEVAIDYSRRTEFAKGVVRTNLARLAPRERLRFVARAAKRHLVGPKRPRRGPGS